MSIFRTKNLDDMVAASRKPGGLKKVLGPFDLILMGIGAIVGTIAALGKTLSMSLTAEGVESQSVRQELIKFEVIPEEWGGDTIFVDVSALTKQGVDKLIEMGAQVILCDPHRAAVIGLERKHRLKGIKMTSPDIRAGVSLLIAALSAKGKSVIHNIEQIDRGYQDIEIRLNNLGADIRRIG